MMNERVLEFLVALPDEELMMMFTFIALEVLRRRAKDGE